MIEFSNITKSYEGAELFKDLSFRVQSDEKMLIRGPSGCGKTTLLKMACALEHPDAGEIRINSKELTPASLRQIRCEVAYAAQESLQDDLTLNELLDETSRFHANRSLDFSQGTRINAIERFNLTQKMLGRRLREFSGGERQRAAMAVMKLLNRKIWILDEVTSGLDEENSRLILKRIEEEKVCALIVSHDPIWIRHRGFKHLDLKALKRKGSGGEEVHDE